MSVTILTLGDPESSNTLVVDVERSTRLPGCFDVTFRVSAWPFSGELSGMMSGYYLEDLRRDLSTDPLPSTLRFGGDRSIELVLELDKPFRHPPVVHGMTATLSWTGDDPIPSITWPLSDIPLDFARTAVLEINRVL